MRFLRIFLGAIFAVLITLLLINQCKSCHRRHPGLHDPDTIIKNVVVTDTIVHDSVRVDTVYIERDREARETEDGRQARQVGHVGDLKVTLLWDFPGDIDVHVTEPNGNEIFYRNKISSTGGQLDVDNRAGGRGSAENVYWTNPPRGRYKVRLNYYDGEGISGTCKVVVIQKGQPDKTYKVKMNHVGQWENVTTVTVE